MYIQSRFTKEGSDWINRISLLNRGLMVTYNLWDNLSWRKDFDTPIQSRESTEGSLED